MKMGASITTGKLAAAGAVAAGLSVGGALLVISAAIDITPKPISAQAPPRPEPTSGDRELLLASLRSLIERSHAVLNATPGLSQPGDTAALVGGRGASIVLWTRDNHSPGVVNLGELLIVSHRPILSAITASTFEFESEDHAGPAVPAHALLAPDPIEALQTASPPVTRVIATDVRAVSIEQAAARGEKTQLTLTLTWDGPRADARSTSVVTAVAPLRRTH